MKEINKLIFAGIFKLMLAGLLLLPAEGLAQANADSLKAAKALAKKAPEGNTAHVEDLHRFLGFETPLPFRYLSLPWDSTMTTNIDLMTIDIGYLLLMLIPLAFFLAPGKNRWWGTALSLFLLSLFLIISIATSALGPEQTPRQGIAALQESSAHGMAAVHEGLELSCIYLYQPLYSAVAAISGANDYITYPLLLGLLALALWMVLSRYREAEEEQKAMLLFALVYGSLWLLLSPGLPWYGYLIFALGPVLLVHAWSKSRENALLSPLVQKAILYGLVSIWVISALSLRMTNYDTKAPGSEKHIFYLPTSMFRLGKMTERKVVDNFRQDYPKVIHFLNRNKDALVYQVGTQISFYVSRSDRRCFNDTFLEFFVKLKEKYPDKRTLIKVLKASGFKFIIIDLGLPNSDLTPEKSLRKKFAALLNTLYDNPQVKLVATDRRIRVKASNELVPEVFNIGNTIERGGSYALFRIK